MRMIARLGRREMMALVESRAGLLDHAENPFATAAWTSHLLEQVARDDWQFWVAGTDEAALLLFAAPQASAQPAALTNYYASLFSPFAGAAEAPDSGVSERMMRDLTDARPALATVNLAPISLADADACTAAFNAAGWITRRYACFGNWHLPCEGLSFDAYMAARPSQTLNTWARKAKKFKPEGSERLQLVTESDDLAAALRAYSQVYAKSWKQPEPYPDFVPGWAAICAQRGWLRLGIAWSGSTPIAAQFWFTINRRAYIFKLAYDQAYSQLSAGTVLSAFMFRHALDIDQVIEVDYLTGDDPYKQSWMTHRRERVGVIACNPRTWQGAARAAYELIGAAHQGVGRRARAALAACRPLASSRT